VATQDQPAPPAVSEVPSFPDARARWSSGAAAVARSGVARPTRAAGGPSTSRRADREGFLWPARQPLCCFVTQHSKDLVSDFARRTLENLDFVQSAKARPDVWEVTQLWNSLLGLVVLPSERDAERLPTTSLAELYAQGWPELRASDGTLPADLRGLVKGLRNAVAHWNIEFLAAAREIDEVRIWNCRYEHGRSLQAPPYKWEIRLRVQTLETLARQLAATYIRELGETA